MAKTMQHKLLKRQVQKYLKYLIDLNPGQEAGLNNFLRTVEASYLSFEENNALLSRAMDLSSQEIFEANRELRLRNREIEVLYKILTIVHGEMSLEAAYDAIIQEVESYTRFPLVMIEVITNDNKKVQYLSKQGQSPEVRESCIRRGTCISLPISSESEVLGTLAIGHPREEGYSKSIYSWLEAVAVQIATKIERVQLQQMMQDQQMKMIEAAKMSELGKMAGGLAHEINTPLGTISLLAEQISEVINGAEVDVHTISAGAHLISNTVVRINKVISGLRSFSRDGSSDPYEVIQLTDLIQAATTLCQQKFADDNVRLLIEIPLGLDLECQFTQISHVILNLLNNSFEAIQSLSEKWIQVKAALDGDHVVMSVTDSGAGLSQTVREQMFNPFFTTKEVGSGTGLGLSISIGIVQAHRGRIYYDENARHTSIIIRLPLRQKRLLADSA